MDPIIPQPQEPQYSAPEHKHFLNKKFIVTFVILLLLGAGAYAGIWYWQNQQVAQEAVPTFTPRVIDEMAGWETHTDIKYWFEFKYPASFEIKKDNVKGVTVYHSIAYSHSDPCDFRDGSQVLNEVIDFNATWRMFDEDIESTVKANYAFPKDIIENGKFKLSPDFVDIYSAGSLKGYRVKIGAEGCGLNTYYFVLDDFHTLVVSQLVTPERTPLITDYEKFLSLPGVIKPADEEYIFNQILSTFKFIKPWTL